MAVVIGIDPGHTGGIAVMEPGGRVLRTYRMPITRGDRPSLDLMQLEYILTHQESHVTMAAIEQVRQTAMAA